MVQPYLCTNGSCHFLFGNRAYMVTDPLKKGTFSFAYVVTPTLALHNVDHPRGLAGYPVFDGMGHAIWKEYITLVANEANVTGTTIKSSCQCRNCSGNWVMMAVNHPILYRFNSFERNNGYDLMYFLITGSVESRGQNFFRIVRTCRCCLQWG